MHELIGSNLNYFWAGVLVETLARTGLRHAVVSPGSRSAPLTTAFALNDQMQATPILDERSAAFFALGLAKATNTPVALVCTSGTAAANYLPAIIEAHYAKIPLIVITADRPQELRDCSAGQAIDQQKIYGRYVWWEHELALPYEGGLSYVRNFARHAFRQARLHAGAVHLNMPFREPLAPTADGHKWVLPDDFFSSPDAPHAILENFEHVFESLREYENGLIIAGPALPTNVESYCLGMEDMVRVLGWPILVDALSPMRHFKMGRGARVGHYDSILRDRSLHADLRPEIVLQVGPLPTSKVLRQFLEDTNAKTWILDPYCDNLDPVHRSNNFIKARVDDLHRLGAYREEDSDHFVAWASAENSERSRLDDALASADFPFEGAWPYYLEYVLPEHTPVFIASSMPVRDAEFFWPVNGQNFRIASNRGANGIDGTLSSALGFVEACRQPGVLVTGDLALLHDQNGLLLAPEFKGSLTILVINNEGGGIFEKLPISSFDPPFEHYFATPQRMNFEKLAVTHGILYHLLQDWDDFTGFFGKLPEQGIRIVEFKTDRKRDTALRSKILNVRN